MRRDCLKLRLSDPSPGSVNSSFHASDSDDESSDRGSRSSRSTLDDASSLPPTITNMQCPSCASKRPKGDNSNTPVRTATNEKVTVRKQRGNNVAPTAAASAAPNCAASAAPNCAASAVAGPTCNLCMTKEELTAIIRKELQDSLCVQIKTSIKDCIATQLREITSEMNNIKESIKFSSDKFEEFKSEVISFKKNVQIIQKENENLRCTVSSLQQRVNQLEQLSRASNLEIQCVPEFKAENPSNIVQQLSKVIDCEVQDKDLVFCSRIAKANPQSSRPRSLLVKFQNQRQRDAYLTAATKFNKEHPTDKLNTSHLGIANEKNTAVYVVEHLTPEIKSLHAATRQKAREIGYKFSWVRNGRVFIRKNESSEYIYVRDADVLKTLGRDELIATVIKLKPDILALNETWTKQGQERYAPKVPGYSLKNTPRPHDRTGGGVGFLIRRGLRVRIKPHPPSELEQMWLELTVPGEGKVVVGTAYRPDSGLSPDTLEAGGKPRPDLV
ncbi:unnamed protein product [Plutella xylostella]|uniref:(diamondback moth) hypothetical protein n=1 Tax=Plutella xylostella TaxID=51655 RepID=A0A8S4EAZ9_PLUXY|nr:unnamed protein product [Plutella xylostella]